MKNFCLLVFAIAIAFSGFSQIPKKESYSFENVLYFKNVPYSSSASAVHLAIDTCASCPQKYKLIRQTAAGGGGGSFINNQFSAVQASSNYWISGNGRIAGRLLIVSPAYSDQGVIYKLQLDSNLLVYGAHSDNTSKIIRALSNSGGERFSVDGGGYSSFNNKPTPSVNADISIGVNGGVFIGDDAGGVLWLNRYSSSEQYGEIYNVQSSTSAGTAGFRVFTHNSGTQNMALSIEATGEIKFPKYVPGSFDGGTANDSVLVITATGAIKKRNPALFGSASAIALNKGTFIESPGAAENVDVWQTPVAITVTSLKAILRGSSSPSVTYNVKFGTDITSATTVFTSDITCTSVTTGCSNSSGFNDATIPAGSFIWIVTTALSGTVNSISFTINYTED